GMQAALTLKELGLSPVILEKEERLGGKLNLWDRLFPTQTPAKEVLEPCLAAVKEAGIEVRCHTAVEKIGADGRSVVLSDGTRLDAAGVIVASGFNLFDARLKEEYGYGIYPNVITSADLEERFQSHRVLTSEGVPPKRVAILHCVGSRDEKVNQNHCSRVCCITGVKQAIEIRQLYPETEVFNFYMDMRMFGAGYEEIYRESQEKYHVNHVRGRISEVSRTHQGRLALKTEDTLIGRPMRMEVDMLVLLVGMCPAPSNASLARSGGLALRASRFFDPADTFSGNLQSAHPNVFFAGTATAPKNVPESMNEGVAAAWQLYRSVKKQAP
ncbi:MAG: CoB--CoM heterodisulfide reductase iron-sulfur subunit A family protein, partial [Rikenellaceae bacterium]|nr:CoB--CoM heterodisulfide reductase iron-sulfur subunit A family protein [Rikenellaceae bacterium]